MEEGSFAHALDANRWLHYGLRIDELRHVSRGMLRTDDAKRIGVIKLVMNDSRNKIHTKTVDISTWLYDEMEAAGVFERKDDEKVFDTTNYYNLIRDLFQLAGVGMDVTFHTLRAANAPEQRVRIVSQSMRG